MRSTLFSTGRRILRLHSLRLCAIPLLGRGQRSEKRGEERRGEAERRGGEDARSTGGGEERRKGAKEDERTEERTVQEQKWTAGQGKNRIQKQTRGGGQGGRKEVEKERKREKGKKEKKGTREGEDRRTGGQENRRIEGQVEERRRQEFQDTSTRAHEARLRTVTFPNGDLDLTQPRRLSFRLRATTTASLTLATLRAAPLATGSCNNVVLRSLLHRILRYY
eukprot:1024706-Rhodomonas_salina.1